MAFVFKLNLSAQVVASFGNEIKYMKEEINNNLIVSGLIGERISDDLQYILSDYSNSYDEFINKVSFLETITLELRTMYEDVIDNYKKSESVFYSKEFISLTSRCGSERNRLLEEYPFLEKADSYSDESIITQYNIPIESNVGKAITHLKKYYKILKFIESNDLLSYFETKVDSYYIKDKEWVLIDTRDSFVARRHANKIQNLINSNGIFLGNLGKVTILPVYKSVKIIGDYTKINFTVIYPNGTENRFDILKTAKETKSNKIEMGLSSDEDLDNEKIEEILKEPAETGYLDNINVNKEAKVIKILKEIAISFFM